jgi:AraC-like DNA-binding protein
MTMDPDAAVARAVVLEESFGPGQGAWHRHRRAQLIHAGQGVIHIHTTQGHWVVPPQRAVWMPPGLMHSVGSSWGYRLQTLYIDQRMRVAPPRPAVIELTPLLQALLAAAARLGAAYPPRGPEARLMRVLLDQLPGVLVRPELAGLHLAEPSDPRLRHMTAAWHADPADARDLDVLASRAGLSLRSATRGFLRETGMTPGDWRTQRRLLAALELLARGYAVTRVALEVGYVDASSFIAVFRRAFGLTPARWAGTLGGGAATGPGGEPARRSGARGGRPPGRPGPPDAGAAG